MATLTLTGRRSVGIEALSLISPRLGDFNEDLRLLGILTRFGAASFGCRSSRHRTLTGSRDHRSWRPSRNGMNEAASPSVVATGSCGQCFRRSDVGKDHAHGLLRGRSGSKRPGPATACGPSYFPSAAKSAPLHRESKIVGPRFGPPPRLRPLAQALRRCKSVPPAGLRRHTKAAMGAAESDKERPR